MNIGLTLTRANQLLEQHFEECSEERHAKNEHVLYNNFPEIREIQSRVYWGVFSWSIPDIQQRWLLKRTAVRLNQYVCSHGDIVRDYLDFYHPKKLRCIGSEARDYQEHISAPLYIRPSTIRDAVYIDIESTFFSIMKLVGWNVGYKAGKWLTVGRAPLDFPLPKEKGARNYLATIGLPKPIIVWNGTCFISENAKSVHINRALWLVIMDILHSIADFAVRLGAVYVHTDGYILPSNRYDIMSEYIQSFGLTAMLKGEGQAYVFGLGNYLIGDKRTKSFDPLRVQNPYHYIRDISTKQWLQKTVEKVAYTGVAERLYRTWNID